MAPVAASIFEIERFWSFARQASGSAGRVAPSADPSVFLARYHLLSKTFGGSLAGALGGVVMVIVVCTYAVEEADEESAKFLDFGRCYNRDRWFGFLATGSFIGTAIGGALGASLTGGRLGRISPLRSTDCSFRDGLRRALVGAAVGSIPAVAHHASGGDALDVLLVAPLFQGGGALIATWGCIAEPRLGPIGPPPIP